MILRRVIALFRKQEWTAIFLIVAGAALAARAAVANPLSSDQIPQALLDECDAQAMPFGSYYPAIRDAVDDLTSMGVFTEPEFRGARIGFCGLRDVEGPAATTSCAHDTILLDSGYAAEDRKLVRNATLAHEMKHYLQHRAQKAEFGERYCFSEQYVADKTRLEEEADAFGDEVGALFFTGRSVEVKNECPVPVSIYLEADKSVWTAEGPLSFVRIEPHATAVQTGRAASKFFRYYAETQPLHGPKQVWGGSRSPDTRIIDGRSYGLTRIALSNPSRSNGPFRMNLSCQPDDDR